MNKQQAFQEYQVQLGERLITEIFPNEFIPEHYHIYKDAALLNVSMAFIQQNFGIDWNEYKQIIVKNDNYSLYEINLINAIILSRTPRELCGSDTAYVVIINTIEEMKVKYDALVKPIQESIQKRIEIMSNAKGNYKESPVKFIN